MAERGNSSNSSPREGLDSPSAPDDETRAATEASSSSNDGAGAESALLGRASLPFPTRRDATRHADGEPESTREFRYHDIIAGKYRLEAAIARGGMGKVFRATQLPLERNVALKVLSPIDRADLDFGERFLREASILAKLQHPHIVTVHDYGRTDRGELFMVMEFIDGLSLSKVLANGGRLSPARTLRIALQTARALRAAHRAGIIHRDLKPSNIMLAMHDEETRDFVKVVDFGLAKLFQTNDGKPTDAEITGTDIMLGSPRYMAPEQIRHQGVGPRTDLYSFGVVMFYMLAGRPPFTAKNARDIMAQHLRDPPPDISRVISDGSIPPRLAALVTRCMAKDKADRFDSADALLEGLTTVAHEIAPLSSSGGHMGISHVTGIVPADYTPAASSLSAAQAPFVGSSSYYVDPERVHASNAAGWRLAALLGLSLCLALGFYAYQVVQSSQKTRTVVINPATAPSEHITIETRPTGLLVLDEAGAVLGTSPVRVPRPTLARPLRVRVRQGKSTSELFRVLVDSTGKTATVDAEVWLSEPEPAPQAAAPPQTIEPIITEEKKTEAIAAPRKKRRKRAKTDRPRSRSATPVTTASKTTPKQAAKPKGNRPTALPRKPRIGVVSDKGRPQVGLVDEEEPKIGIIEE